MAGQVIAIKAAQGQTPILITINPRVLHLQDRITVTETAPTLRQSIITAALKAPGTAEHRWGEHIAHRELPVHQELLVHREELVQRELQNRGGDK